VTNLLLEGERRKLLVLQREAKFHSQVICEAASLKSREKQQRQLTLAISRIEQQCKQLEQEYRQACLGALRNANARGCGK
ncbi:hypothetical protein QYM36_000772, partial [Artemia franciscana]